LFYALFLRQVSLSFSLPSTFSPLTGDPPLSASQVAGITDVHHQVWQGFISVRNHSRALVAHVCNPSYSRGRDQEDRSSKPARENSFTRPYLEKPFTKIGLLVEWLRVKALSSNPSTTKKKRKKETTDSLPVVLIPYIFGPL
jgi:hypothetical protein